MMIRSINHLQTPLESIKENPKDIKENAKLVELIPEPEDFEILKKVAPILSKFESISQSLSADQTPTICYVVPKLHFITRFLTSMINKKDQDEFITQLSQVKKLKGRGGDWGKGTGGTEGRWLGVTGDRLNSEWTIRSESTFFPYTI